MPFISDALAMGLNDIIGVLVVALQRIEEKQGRICTLLCKHRACHSWHLAHDALVTADAWAKKAKAAKVKQAS